MTSHANARRPRVPLRHTALAQRARAILVFAAVAAGNRTASGQRPQDARGELAREKLTMKSVVRVDLARGTAVLPLHRGSVGGKTMWYVITDVSDRAEARRLGVNFAPRLANSSNGCPGCVQMVRSSDPLFGRETLEFPGGVDFAPTRVLVPGPTGFPPVRVAPGASGDSLYSPLVRMREGGPVYNAPIVATGDGAFDVDTHANTGDRVMAIDTRAMTVELLLVRAFSHGQDILYLSFETSDPLSATIERGTLAPGLGLLPFANASDHPMGARDAIFAFANGQTGAMSPPAQGLNHVIIDGRQAVDASVHQGGVVEALRAGGDAHNVLDFFPTLSDAHQAELYTPMWDLHVVAWSKDAVARKANVAQKDANQIRQLAARGMITNPGGVPQGSANIVVNCPVVGFLDAPPRAPQAAKPRNQP